MAELKPNIVIIGVGLLLLAAYAIDQGMKDAVLVLVGGMVGVVIKLADKG